MTTDAKELTTETAATKRVGVRSPYRTSVATNLRPERLARLLRAADDGDTYAYFTLAQEIEERDTHYDSVLRARKMAVAGADPIVRAASDKRRDQKIAEAVREHIVARPEFEGMVFDLLDGLGKGISLVELIWETTPSLWRPKAYKAREQRHFVWDEDTLETPRLVTDAEPNRGEDLAPMKWAVHTPRLRTGPSLRGGLARSACVVWMLKSFTLRDLMAFMEVFGMPYRIGKYGPGATPDQRAELERAVSDIAADAGCVIPESMKIDFAEPGSRSGGERLFLGAADYWNRELSKLVLGQTMTTENGASLSQAAVHERKELSISRADARAVAATITRDIITPFVRLNFGDDASVPTLAWEIRGIEETKVWMANVASFVNLGGEVEQSVVRDRLGLPDPPQTVDGQDPPKLLRAQRGAANPTQTEGDEPAKPEPSDEDEEGDA